MPRHRLRVLLTLSALTTLLGLPHARAEFASCDLVTLRARAEEPRLTDETWIAYTTALAHVLATAGTSRQPLAETNRVITALQEEALKSVAPAALARFRSSPDCRLVVDLKPDATAPLGNAATLAPAVRPHAALLGRLARAALENLESELSRIRFRSEADRTRFRAATWCHVASLVSSARVGDTRLETFGRTVGCTAAGRTD